MKRKIMDILLPYENIFNLSKIDYMYYYAFTRCKINLQMLNKHTFKEIMMIV